MAVVCLTGALLSASAVWAAEDPPPEFDPVLSLTGNCVTNSFDPVPDPSCVGEPPAYPPPPERPSGRFNEPSAIAIDPYGNEYVASYAEGDDAKGRVDVFDDEGRFITEVGTPDPKSIAVDSKGHLYVFQDDGEIFRYDPSGEYEPEAGVIAYENPAIALMQVFFVGALAIDSSNDHLIVAHQGNITRYKSAEEGNEEIESFTPEDMGPWSENIAVDAQGRRIFVSFCRNASQECGVKVVGADPPHSTLEDIEGPSPEVNFSASGSRLGLAVDEETGDLFVADMEPAKTVYQFNEDYETVSQFTNSEFLAVTLIQIAVSNGERKPDAEPCAYPDPADVVVPPGDACNRHYVFIPVVKPAGRALAFQPSDVGAPETLEVSTGEVGETEAELKATIDPRGAETTYAFEITSQEAFEAEGFAGAAVLEGGTIGSDSLATEVSAFAGGLIPAGTYRFRVLAENEVGKASEEGQNEATFTTYSDAPISSACPNQGLRVGLAARLADCRAYELVTPTDTLGRPPRGVGFGGSLFTTVLASPAGNALSFRILGGSLPGSSGVAAFEGDFYVTKRSAAAWVTQLASPTGAEATFASPGSTSPDQGYLFWTANEEGPLVVNGEETTYIRYPDGHSELIGVGSLGTDPKAEGKLITADATHIVFETRSFSQSDAVKLEPNAPPNGTRAVYDRTIDPETGIAKTHVVSLLPGNVTPDENAAYVGASKDGEGIAFSISNTLYLRVGNEVTYEIGENVEFAGVSEGGGHIFYVEGGDLNAFDTDSEEVVEFSASGDVTPVNVAAGGARAYFSSPTVLGGANPEGDTALAGKQNLYLSEEGAISFVATLTDADMSGGLGLWTKVARDQQLALDPSRLNPNGSVLLFESRANITGYNSGGFPQIYRYDSSEDRLHCISCIPTETPATGGASLASYTLDTYSPKPFSSFGFVPNLIPNGKRVFFESTEPLVSTDTDEVRDVYEWEEGGVGNCERPGGCVYLISSGQSNRDNFLYAHSESGDDVFFTTGDALTGFDTGGSISIYDAKVGGGFPGPVPSGPCVADGCRPSLSPPPPASSAQSSAQDGSGNTKPGKAKTCPKGKRKMKKNGKVRCVKKKKQKGGKAKQRAGAGRGAGK